MHERAEERSKRISSQFRHLIRRYNPRKSRQFSLGISVPVATTKRGGLVFNSGFQMNYVLPWNVSQLEPMIIPARRIRDVGLQDAYVAIENLLDE